MFDFDIVDAHLHLWDPLKIRYPWLDGDPLLNKPYLLDDYNRACDAVRVGAMVFIQAEADFSLYRQEAEWVASIARQDPRIQGIVAWAPLEKGDRADPELETLASINLVRGIRRIIEFEPDREFCLTPDFIRGVRLLPKHGMSFDICINHVHMENTIELVRQCPQVSFILDHIGKPDIKRHLLEPWKTHLKILSAFPNVWCKMSGLVSEADHSLWRKEDLKPYIDHVLKCFGFDRVIFGGDWPVATRASDYHRWLQALLWALEGCSDSERRRLFRDNAIGFYRLPAAS